MQSTRRCVVIGACGQVGQALSHVFAQDYQLTQAVYHAPKPGQLHVDLGDSSSVQAVLETVKPDVVLIAGAYTYVEGAEAEPDLCRQVNVLGPQQVAQYAQQHDAVVVNYSTDHVFDGSRDEYVESDPVCPLNVYSQSKVEVEAALREVLPERHLILRTAWVYGPDPQQRNFVVRLVNALRAGEPVRVPSDQWGSPTYTEDLAQVTLALVQRGVSGTVHATGPDFINRIELARRVCVHFGLNAGLLEPLTTSQLQQVAKRPLKVRLSTQTLVTLGGPVLRGLDAGLEAFKSWYVDAVVADVSRAGADT